MTVNVAINPSKIHGLLVSKLCEPCLKSLVVNVVFSLFQCGLEKELHIPNYSPKTPCRHICQ